MTTHAIRRSTEDVSPIQKKEADDRHEVRTALVVAMASGLPVYDDDGALVGAKLAPALIESADAIIAALHERWQAERTGKR